VFLAALNRVLSDRFQWLYPKEFRILNYPVRVDQGEKNPPDRVVEKIIVQVANGLWDVLRFTKDPETKQPKPEMQDVNLVVRNLLDDLAVSGVKLVDLTGEEYVRGTIKASFITDEKLIVPTILEMEWPRVLWRGRQIYMGEAIVGEPPRRVRKASG
jgi:hypothetical protein